MAFHVDCEMVNVLWFLIQKFYLILLVVVEKRRDNEIVFFM